jgi:hypothetical protein
MGFPDFRTPSLSPEGLIRNDDEMEENLRADDWACFRILPVWIWMIYSRKEAVVC